MHQQIRHTWTLSPSEACALQREMQSKVVTVDRFDPPRLVAGVDVGFEARGSVTRAAVAVLSFPDLNLVDQAIARQPTHFPYIPGLLSFREIPAIIEALQRLHQSPDMLLCDGQGMAHPRRFGLACHLGLLMDTPSIGVAKTRLIGKHGNLSVNKGAWTALEDKGEIIGAVLRTRAGVKPLYISIGHRISLESAIHYVMACTTGYKLPETTRFAHHLASH